MNQLMLNAESTDVDLKAHVGHKVEVTGTMAGRMGGGAASTTGGAATTGSTTAESGTSGSSAGAATAGGQRMGGRTRTMNVTALKMISADCGS
jgi:hypothetical protein